MRSRYTVNWSNFTYQRIVDAIEKLSKEDCERMERVDISHCKLTELPEQLRRFVNLKQLLWYDNSVLEVPLWIQEFPLTMLAFQRNGTPRFPPLRMPRLTHFYVSGNRLENLPYIVRTYPLKDANFDDNRFPVHRLNRWEREETGVRELLDEFLRHGCLVALNWRPTVEIHACTSAQTHAQVLMLMLISKRAGLPRDLAKEIAAYVCALNL